MNQTATIRQVAELAGVSIMTVSRVLNNKPGASQATIEAVSAAAEAIGYRPNQMAKNLRQNQRSRMVALVIGDISNPFYAILAKSIEQAAKHSGYAVVILNTDEDPELERRGVEDLLARQIDGVLIVSCLTSHEHLEQDLRSGTSFVFIDRPPVDIGADCVLLANRAGAMLATTTLIEAGHERIGYIGDYSNLYSASERLIGYQSAMENHNLPTLTKMDVHTSKQAAEVTTDWLASDNPPTAIFGGNNLLAEGVHRSASSQSGQTEVVGFDRIPGFEREEVATVHYDIEQVAESAWKLLSERLDGGSHSPRTQKIETHFVYPSNLGSA